MSEPRDSADQHRLLLATGALELVSVMRLGWTFHDPQIARHFTTHYSGQFRSLRPVVLLQCRSPDRSNPRLLFRHSLFAASIYLGAIEREVGIQDMTRYRPQRGSLADSMKACVEVQTLDHLIAILGREFPDL